MRTGLVLLLICSLLACPLRCVVGETLGFGCCADGPGLCDLVPSETIAHTCCGKASCEKAQSSDFVTLPVQEASEDSFPCDEDGCDCGGCICEGAVVEVSLVVLEVARSATAFRLVDGHQPLSAALSAIRRSGPGRVLLKGGGRERCIELQILLI